MVVRVIGLGQRVAGDDGVGLCVLDALEQDPPAGVELCRVADAAQLVELVQGAERVVVVDAAVAAGPPGTVRTLDAAALADSALAPVSTHGVGVGQALELATVLPGGVLPPIVSVAIAIDRPSGYSTELSGPVRAAVALAATKVRDLTRS